MKEIVRRVNMPDSGAMKQMSANSSLSIFPGLFHAPFDLTMKKKEMTHAQGTIFKEHRGLFLGDFSVFSLVTQSRFSGPVYGNRLIMIKRLL